MKHDIFAEVGQSNSQPFDAVATIRHGSLSIKVGTTCDNQPFETGLNLAKKWFVGWRNWTNSPSGYPSIRMARSIRAAGLPRALFGSTRSAVDG